MKKTVSGILLALASVFALVACDKDETTAAGGTGTGTKPAAKEGKTLNIRVWNDEFQGRLRNFYSGYVSTDDDGVDTLKDGTKLVWNMVESKDLAYQNALDEALENQSSAKADDKIDMFLIEADYALKYVNSPYAMDLVNELGMGEYEFSQQYQYTKDIVSVDGKLKASSWQATPGLVAYRTDIAEELWGEGNFTPEYVQAKIADWAKFEAVAAEAKAKNFKMVSGYDDTYRAFTNSVTAKMVTGDISSPVLTIPDVMWQWVKQTKTFTTNEYNNKTSLWGTTWGADMAMEGKVFCYFWSTWGINFSLADYAGTAGKGYWRVCEGPADYYWGGTWLCAATGTDNQTLVKDIIRELTCNSSTMRLITMDTDDFTNNTAAMEVLATDPDYGSEFLGGQNHVKMFFEKASQIDMSNTTIYDQAITEKFQGAMMGYYEGTATLAEAWATFKTNFKTIYANFTDANIKEGNRDTILA